ncbi:hypothetical protein [Nocardioides sambongensis]|uniref:hypothetical protein n=1 Tax=Nocardioides sambongensis TaxID=2589074 RepID=UPI00112C49E7|nr:hypothetical protein [Nocardioides sambongensis]
MSRLLVLLGVLVAGYGGWLLLTTQDGAAVRATVVWAAVAVLVHDAVLAPIAIGLGWGARAVVRRTGVPRRPAAAAAVVLVVLGTVTLVAVPVLGGFGEEPTNDTLLPGDYGIGWVLVAAFSLLAATLLALTGLVSEERPGRSDGGPGARRRR